VGKVSLPIFSFMENPELSDLRQMAKKDEIPNRYGIPVYHSKIKSRSAKFTEYHYEITPDLENFISRGFPALPIQKMDKSGKKHWAVTGKLIQTALYCAIGIRTPCLYDDS